MTQIELQDAVYDLISPYFGAIPMRWADQDDPRGNTPFVVARLITGQIRVGEDDYLRRDQVLTMTLSAKLEAGDTISGKVNGEDVSVTYATSYTETIRELCNAIRGGDIYYVKPDRTDELKIKIRSFENATLTAWDITGAKSVTVAQVRNTDGTLLSGMRRMTVSLNVYGQAKDESGDVTMTAQDILEQLYGVLCLPAFIDAARQLEIAIIGASEPQNLTEIMDTGHEDRAQMDVFIHVPFERSGVSGGFVETAGIEKI